jgi:hypothetical protein
VSFGNQWDSVFFYAKNASNVKFTPVKRKHTEDYIKSFNKDDHDGKGPYVTMPLKAYGVQRTAGRKTFEWRGVIAPWLYSEENLDRMWEEGRIYITSSGDYRYKHHLKDTPGSLVSDLWVDDEVLPLQGISSESLDFPTQKPEALLKRIILTSSNPGDLVADFFCGSGRRWLGCDLGRFAIHTTRKRLLDIPDCQPFEILNLGKYERKYWQMNGIKGRQEDSQKAIFEYLAFIVKLYHAEPVIGFSHLHGRKAGRMVHVGATDAPVTLSEIIDALGECSANKLTALDVLGWEWEMGLHDVVGGEARRRGVDLRLLNIPREVMDKRAVEAGDVHFYELAYVETEVRQQGTAVQVALKDFIIPSLELVPLEVRAQVKKWSDYIDYWAVDWDFKEDTFHNQWQSYRTRKHPTLTVESEWHNYSSPGTYKLLVKIVDIFGNDTTKLLEAAIR